MSHRIKRSEDSTCLSRINTSISRSQKISLYNSYTKSTLKENREFLRKSTKKRVRNCRNCRNLGADATWFFSLKIQRFPWGRNLHMACNESEQIADKSRALEKTHETLQLTCTIICKAQARYPAYIMFPSIETITFKRNHKLCNTLTWFIFPS